MTDLQLIISLITLSSCILTGVKIYEKRTKWYWNFAPIIVGFTGCMWLALIIG